MSKLSFRPRKSFEKHLRFLAKIDPSIVDEAKAAIEILLEGEKLPPFFHDHKLKRKLTGYNEFHLRDTPKGQQPSEINDVVIIYKIKHKELILVAVDIGSHIKMFGGTNQKRKYKK